MEIKIDRLKEIMELHNLSPKFSIKILQKFKQNQSWYLCQTDGWTSYNIKYNYNSPFKFTQKEHKNTIYAKKVSVADGGDDLAARDSRRLWYNPDCIDQLINLIQGI